MADEAGAGGGPYAACDPAENLAAFLLFPKLKLWCIDNGYGPDFGPYGGAPADDAEAAGSENVLDEAAPDEALDEEA